MSLRRRLRYRFDNYMAKGLGAQILLLALAALAVFVVTGAMLKIFDAGPTDAGNVDSFGHNVWRGLTHTLDAGTIGNDDAAANWKYLFIMLFATIGGIFVVSALIGVLTQGFGEQIETWRRGRSAVMEKDHTVILGWTNKVPTLLHELAVANDSVKKPVVVVLADRDKVEMDAEAAAVVKKTRLRVVTRRGSPMAMADLRLVNLAESKAIIVLTPEVDSEGEHLTPPESDTVVLKTLLAVAKIAPNNDCGKLHLVAELYDERTEAVARRVVGDNAALLRASPLVSRLLVQTGRQSGLSVVYSELLDFEGNEIYQRKEPSLAGKTFREAMFAYDTAAVIGVLTADNKLLLPPPLDRTMASGDQLIVIAEDDSTIRLDGTRTEAAFAADDHIAPAPEPRVRASEKTLVLGASARLHVVLHELDQYVAAGSTTHVVGEHAVDPADFDHLAHMVVTTRVGDVTDRVMLDELDITSFDHVIVLSETPDRTQEMADARTTVCLLHLRDIERIAGKRVPITSEILDIQNRDLASVAEADDFIVSNTLVSLMVSQIAENPHLVQVFDELFSPEGFELYLKPASNYVKPGALAFGAVCEAALRRGEIAIGYRLAAAAKDPETGFGVVVNPMKSKSVTLGANDRVIVLAES